MLKLNLKSLLIPLIILSVISCSREQKQVNPESTTSNLDSLTIETNSDVNNKSAIKLKKINVFIENSLSMYGYLPNQSQAVTNFRDATNELLIHSKHSFPTTNRQVALINNERTFTINSTDNLNEIDETSLNNKYSQGRGNSDFDNLFEKIMDGWQQEEISIFIADFIYSPGSSDVTTGLNRLRQNITNAFLSVENTQNLAVNILHLESDFHGIYYDNQDNKIEGIKNRPYFIFIIGNNSLVESFSEEISTKLEKYNLLNNFYLTSSTSTVEHYSALPYTLNIGQFDARGNTSNGTIKSVNIKNTTKHKSNLQLAIIADLSEIPLDNISLLNKENYSLSTDKVELIEIGEIKDNQIFFGEKREAIKSNDLPFIKNATHVFLISLPSSFNGDIDLSLMKSIPEWIKRVTIDGDDLDIKNDPDKQKQTFGFSYIVDGVYNALVNNKNEANKNIFKISLNINQEKSGLGLLPILGGLAIIGLIAIMILLRIKKNN